MRIVIMSLTLAFSATVAAADLGHPTGLQARWVLTMPQGGTVFSTGVTGIPDTLITAKGNKFPWLKKRKKGRNSGRRRILVAQV